MRSPISTPPIFIAILAALLCVFAPSVSAQPTEALGRAVVLQEVAPALQARQLGASAKIAAREGFVAGDVTFVEAFPHLVDANLWELGVLEGRLLTLDADGVARILERDRLLAEHGDVADLSQTLLETHRAESRADTLERELLQAALARRTAHPQLMEPLPEPDPIPDDATDEDRARAAALADASYARWRAALRTMLVSSVRAGSMAAPTSPLVSQRDAHTAALWLPFLAEEDANERADALAVWWSEWADRTIAQDKVPEASTLAEVDAEREALSVALSMPISAAASLGAEERRRVGQARLAQLEARAVALRVQDAEEQDASLSLRVAQEEAEASKALAEEARRSAEDEGSRTRAEVFALRATSEQDRAARWAQVEREQESNAQARDTAAEMLAELSARVVSIEERHRLDPGRADPVETYRAIMEHRTRWMHDDVYVGRFVQEEVQRHAETLAALGEERTKLQSFRQGSRVTDDQELVDALDAWSLGIEDGQLASEASLAASIERYTDVTRDVRELHSLRRRLRAYVPLSLRRAETGGLLQSVVLEGRHWLVSLKIGWAPRLNEIRTFPREAIKVDMVGHVLWVLFWTGSLLLVWLIARQKTDELSAWLAARVCATRPELDQDDARALAGPMHRTLKAAVDLLLGWGLVGQLGEIAFELSFLLMVYLQFALYRAVVALFDLLVVRPAALRPALLTLRKGYWSLVRQTVRYVAIYGIVWGFLSFFLWDLAGLDRIERLVSTGFFIGVFVGLVLLMHVWSSTLQEMLRNRRAAGWLAEWAARPRETVPTRFIAGLTSFGLLLWLLVTDLVDWLTRTHLGAQWVANVVGRYRLKPGREERSALSLEHYEMLTERRPPAPEAVLVSPEWVSALDEMWERREAGEPLQVVLAHSGRGGGKRTACDVAQRWAETKGHTAVRVRMCAGSHTEQGLTRVLASAAGLDGCSTLRDVQARLEEHPSTMFIVEDLDRVFRRVVGGFETFRCLMDLVQSSSQQHQWVLTIHRPAYAYLTALGPMVDVAFLPTTVALASMSVEELRQKVLERTEETGLRLDFSDLVRRASVASDLGVEQERAERSFFRLLRDASGGNLHVALHLWARSLEPHPTRSGWAKVFAGDALHPDIKESLSDLSWFVLHGLWVQPLLTAEDVAASLNLSIADVHRALQELVAHGIVEATGDEFGLKTARIPAVERSLRRRNLLHLGG